MATIPGIQAKVGSAVQKLIKADFDNPKTTMSAGDVAANPYRSPPGQNGAVDKTEAATVDDPFARSVFQAAASKAGEKIEEGGFVNGHLDLRESVLPKWDVTYGDLHGLQSDVNLIVAKLETDSTGSVTQAALDALPATVADYFKSAWGHTRPLPPQTTIDSIARVIREAATGVVEWR